MYVDHQYQRQHPEEAVDILKLLFFNTIYSYFFLVSGSPTEETAPLVPGTRPVPLGGSQVRIFNILILFYYYFFFFGISRHFRKTFVLLNVKKDITLFSLVYF